jgi:hypothetical protein
MDTDGRAMTKPAYLSTRYWIPATEVNEDDIDDLYVHHQFELSRCRFCRNNSIKPVDECNTCESFKGSTQLYIKRQTENGVYYGVPLAEWRKARRILHLEHVKITDLRKRIDFPQDLRWTGKLYDGSLPNTANQVRIVDDFWRNAFDTGLNAGIIQATPRTGKTVIAVNIVCELGFRAIITGAELGWLEQFVDTFISHTNVSELHNAVVLVSNKQSSRHYRNVKGVRVVTRVDQIPSDACVVLFAYQAFIADKNKVINYLHNKFTTIVVDEVHIGAAAEFSSLLNNLDVTYRIGLSATVDRNDGQSPIAKRLMGTVAAISDTIIMSPEFHLVETGVTCNADSPTARVTYLAANPTRNKIVVKHVFQDLLADPQHYMFIPVTRTTHMQRLAKMINEQAAFYNAEARRQGKPAPFRMPVAITYYGGTADHKAVRSQAISGAVRVIVAVDKKVKHGISIPTWTHVYTGLAPIANGPGYYQLTQRVCTPPAPGTTKPQPVIRHFIDAMPASAKTFRNLWDSVYNPVRGMLEEGIISMSDATRERVNYIVARAESYDGPEAVTMAKRKKKMKNATGGFLGIRR